MLTKKLRLWLGLPAFLLISPSLLAEGAPAASTAARASTTVMVEAADQAPTSTGIIVRKGRRYLIEATGTWCMGGLPPTAECGGPQGIRPANPAELPLILNKAKIGKLIGRIGDGPWFAIGRRARINAKRNGPLVLLFNDRPCCYGDNSGAIRVEIQRLRN